MQLLCPLQQSWRQGCWRVKKLVGLTSHLDSHNIIHSNCFFSSRICQRTWSQDLRCCFGNEKGHSEREPQVWSLNPIADNVQQVQNLSRRERSVFRRGRLCHPRDKQEATAGRTLCAFLTEMLSALRWAERSLTPCPESPALPSSTMRYGFLGVR